jgi:hypothetical protein
MESPAAEANTPEPAGQEIRPEITEEPRRWYIDEKLLDEKAVDGKQKPVWEMSADELGRAARELEAKGPEHEKVLTQVFGPKNAAKFARLVESESPRDIETARKMHEGLRDDNKKAIVDELLDEGGTVAASELRELEDKVREVQRANSPRELSYVLKRAITELGDRPHPQMSLQELGAMMQVSEGYRIASNKVTAEKDAWDITRISDEVVSAAARRLPHGDLIPALRRFFEPLSGEVPAIRDFAIFLSHSARQWWEKNRPPALQTSTPAPRHDLGHDGGHSA